jgi:hypothetical protein
MRRSDLSISLSTTLWLLGIALAVAVPADGRAQVLPGVPACGTLENHYGPYDYRRPGDKLSIVERFHFTPQVYGLIRGQSGYIGGDLSYTLHAFPNHHRALVAMQRLAERQRTTQPEGADLPVECYFERAVRFAPDDVLARTLYALFLNGKARRSEAIEQLELATPYAAEDGPSHAKIGLAYVEVGDLDRALRQAHRARQLDFVAADLEDQLRRRNRWRDPPPASAAPASAAASAP